MADIARLRSELAVAELTEDLIAAKESGDVEGKRRIAAALRGAREQHRIAFPADPPGPGDAAAAPKTITAAISQKG